MRSASVLDDGMKGRKAADLGRGGGAAGGSHSMMP